MKKSIYTYFLPLALLPMMACNVHEWPKDSRDRYTFTLYMNFDHELPLHKEVVYNRSAGEESRGEESNYDIRYIVNVYEVSDENDNNRFVSDTFTFSQPFVTNHNYQVVLKLPEGKYKFRVWVDHVNLGSIDDNFYITKDFTEIYLNDNGPHPGSNELRDAYKGTAYGEVYDAELFEQRYGKSPDNSAIVKMMRPMGRYEFQSTDMDQFLDKAIENIDAQTLASALAKAEASRTETDTKSEVYWNGLTRDEIAEAIGLNDYNVKFTYNAFMPSSYNFYTDKPSDSSTGITYNSKMQIGSNGNMQMGFDYILVDDETTMNLNMQVYNKDGDMISSVAGVQVPVARSKNTVVKGTFLTVTSGGGVAINPDFEGDDYNIEIH